MATLETVMLGLFPFTALIALACVAYYFHKASRKKREE